MIAGAPVDALIELGTCRSCGIELTRFNRQCPHERICLGCWADIEDACRGRPQ